MNPLCIYHANCADGFTAAWVVNRYFKGAVDFHPGVYTNSPPDVTDRDVIILDFSYKRPVIQKMLGQCFSMLILDHHKSAAVDLSGFINSTDWPTAHVVFDMERSGARITWDHFFPDESPPPLLLYVEDRDLWRFSLPESRNVNAALFSYEYDFLNWDLLMSMSIGRLAKDGEAIERKHHKDIRELVKVMRRMMEIDGCAVPVANLPYTLTSDAGQLMAVGEWTEDNPEFPFAACYWDTPEGRVFSLRSATGGADVQAVAVKYGGGGHRNAAGFRVPFNELTEGMR